MAKSQAERGCIAERDSGLQNTLKKEADREKQGHLHGQDVGHNFELFSIRKQTDGRVIIFMQCIITS